MQLHFYHRVRPGENHLDDPSLGSNPAIQQSKRTRFPLRRCLTAANLTNLLLFSFPVDEKTGMVMNMTELKEIIQVSFGQRCFF